MMQAKEIQSLPLRDIKLPSEPGFWPLAPGWWVLILIVLCVLLWLGYVWFRHLQKKRRWQQIDQQFSEIEFKFKQQQNKQKLLTEVSVFLRRFVKYQLNQPHASTLSGSAWIAHLNQLQKNLSFTPFEDALTDGIFQSSYDFDSNALITTTRDFIKLNVMKPFKTKTKEASHV